MNLIILKTRMYSKRSNYTPVGANYEKEKIESHLVFIFNKLKGNLCDLYIFSYIIVWMNSIFSVFICLT